MGLAIRRPSAVPLLAHGGWSRHAGVAERGRDLMQLPERPCGGFRAIYADPAWRYELWSDAGEAKSPQAHYHCERLDVMKAMRVAPLAARNSARFMGGA